jgi:protoporphyrinogen oxidase
MSSPRTVVLGGGLSGLAAALVLAESGWPDVVVLERGAEPGGLAGSFERNGRWYPLGYHHILKKDKTLLSFLHRIGARRSVGWRRVRMLFELNGTMYDLGTPTGFATFPIPLTAKLGFVRLMLHSFLKRRWSDWEGRSARELVELWGGDAVRQALFEPLCQLKFQLPSEQVSAAWLGARLHFREGSTPLGYMPGTNWTKVLCDGVTALAARAGVTVRVNTPVAALETQDNRVVAARLDTGERVEGDVFVATVPPPVYRALVGGDDSPGLASITYTALISMVCAMPAVDLPSFYWLNLSDLRSTACAIFRLDALNETIGGSREMCLNFVTHLASSTHPLFTASDDSLLAAYGNDLERLFHTRLSPSWVHVARVPMYSPVFTRDYRNPPVRSTTWSNVYFAGNYRTYPSVASTGTALASGLDTAAAILGDQNRREVRSADARLAAA